MRQEHTRERERVGGREGGRERERERERRGQQRETEQGNSKANTYFTADSEACRTCARVLSESGPHFACTFSETLYSLTGFFFGLRVFSFLLGVSFFSLRVFVCAGCDRGTGIRKSQEGGRIRVRERTKTRQDKIKYSAEFCIFLPLSLFSNLFYLLPSSIGLRAYSASSCPTRTGYKKNECKYAGNMREEGGKMQPNLNAPLQAIGRCQAKRDAPLLAA